MFKPVRILLCAATAAAGLLFAAPDTTQANDDNYWNGYWSWYDRSYRPYYHRYRSYDSYDYHPGYREYYGPRVYRDRYPHYPGHHRRFHPHEAYQFGPFRIERWH